MAYYGYRATYVLESWRALPPSQATMQQMRLAEFMRCLQEVDDIADELQEMIDKNHKYPLSL